MNLLNKSIQQIYLTMSNFIEQKNNFSEIFSEFDQLK